MINQEDSFLPNRWVGCIGVIVEPTTKKNQRWFHIYVPELLPTITGDVSAENVTQNIQITNIWGSRPTAQENKTVNILKGTEERASIDITKTIYAEYGGFDPAQDVPTMNRGMQVMVFNYASTDKWYWVPLERDRSFKTFEHVRFSAMDQAIINKSDASRDNTEERNAAITDDNTYFLEIDTKYHKHVKIRTASSDGEPFRYLFLIDAASRTVEISDESSDGSQPSNFIRLESKPHDDVKGRIILQNADGNTFSMDGPDLIIHVPRNVMLDIGGSIMKMVKGDQASTVGGNTSELTKGTLSQTVMKETNHSYGSNVTDSYATDFTETIVNTHTETQDKRLTTATNSTWMSQGFSLTTSQLIVNAETVSATYIVASAMIGTASVTVTAASTLTLGLSSITVLPGSKMVWPGGTIIGQYYPAFNGLG